SLLPGNFTFNEPLSFVEATGLTLRCRGARPPHTLSFVRGGGGGGAVDRYGRLPHEVVAPPPLPCPRAPDSRHRSRPPKISIIMHDFRLLTYRSSAPLECAHGMLRTREHTLVSRTSLLPAYRQFTVDEHPANAYYNCDKNVRIVRIWKYCVLFTHHCFFIILQQRATGSISTFGNSIDSSYLLSVSYPVAACSRSSQEFYFRLRIISALSKTKPTTEMADLQTLADKSDGMERKLDAILARLDKLDVMEADMKNLQSNFETDRKHVESKIHVQNSKIVSIEVRLRRKNLIWHGIERSEESDESDLSLIINIVNNIMKVPCSEAEFVDVYRIGKPEEGKVRPICTEFKHLDYKWKVLNQKKALFGSNIFVNLDLPIELRGPRTKRSRPDESNENPGPEDSRKRPPSSPAAQNQSKKNHTAFDRNVRPQQLRNNPTSQKNQGGSKSDNFFRPAK
ncbi:unnamed protein product, partial [Nesidiocoris tenuis]